MSRRGPAPAPGPSRPFGRADLEAQYRQVLAWRAEGHTISFMATSLSLPWDHACRRLQAAQRWQAQRAPVLTAQTPAHALRISLTVLSALRRPGLQTVGQVHACSDADLLGVRGLDRRVLVVLRADLAARYQADRVPS